MARAQPPPLIRKLLSPSAYPHPVSRVELLQTHISYVLLAGDYAYKIKKPVNFGFLDYSSLAKRRYYCQQEVILNRRFCHDTYLGVLAIREKAGRDAFSGSGKIIEYAVQMRRLPLEKRLDVILESGQASEGMLEAVAQELADSHARAATGPNITRSGERSIRRAWRENFQQWHAFIGRTITEEEDRLLRSYVRYFFRQRGALLKKRAGEGKIRDCHGDLRSDSICFLEDGICIFDCIEFNSSFRYTDVAGDVGFLAMDLDYRGHPELAEGFVRKYTEVSRDEDLAGVMDFYRCYRAAVRGKVEGFRLEQPEVSAREKREALQAARRYFQLACRYAQRDRPLLLITYGLSGTGKSTLARAVAGELDLEMFSSDIVRKGLAGLAPEVRRFEPYGKGIYSPGFTDKTYRELLYRAAQSLLAGRSVILDATFSRKKHRQWARKLAEALGAHLLCIECVASDTVVRRRMRERLRDQRGASDALWETYLAQKQTFEPPDELTAEERLLVKSLGALPPQVAAVRHKLGR